MFFLTGYSLLFDHYKPLDAKTAGKLHTSGSFFLGGGRKLVSFLEEICSCDGPVAVVATDAC